MKRTIAETDFETKGQSYSEMAKKKHGLYSDENAIFGQNGANLYHGGYEHASAQVEGSSRIHNVARGLSDGGGHLLVQNADVSSMKEGHSAQGFRNNGKNSFASLFKDNRVADESCMLKYIDPPMGEMEIGFDEIDTVEQAFGFCLVGYVMGPRPKPYVMLNVVKRWGNNVKFTFKDNGWIKFQFPSELERDEILNGGPIMIMGRHLSLQKLPRCFLFSRDDMVFIPSWVQIHGLPADCWTTKALSRIASVVGKPIHTDKLTISKKGYNYARVLVELDAKKPHILDYVIKLPTGKKISLKFIYEHEPKFCDKCNSMGHLPDLCAKQEDDNGIKGGYIGRRNRRGRSRLVDRPIDGNDIDDPVGQHSHGPILCGDKEIVMEDEEIKVLEKLDPELEQGVKDVANSSTDDIPPVYEKEEVGDENSVKVFEDMEFLSYDFELDSFEAEGMFSRVVPQDKDEWIKTGKKNKRFVKTKKNCDSGSSSMETEYVPIDPRTKLPLKGGASKFLKKKLAEMHLPRR